MPYNFQLRKKGDKDKLWDLTNLRTHDPTLSDNHILDILEDFLQQVTGNLDKNKDDEKAVVVKDYNVDKSNNLVEAIISTGDFGYRSELRDVNSGQVTHNKSTSEAELIPYYLSMWIPETVSGDLYESGQRGIMVFQRINGRSIMTRFKKRFHSFALTHDDCNTMLEMNPITRQEVLRKVLQSQSVKRIEIEVDEVPADTEKEVQYIEGMDTHDAETQSIVLKPKRGGSLLPIKSIARQLKRDGGSFAQVVSDDVLELKTTIKNEHGKKETFSLIDDKLRMRKELDPSQKNLNGGLPTTSYLADQAALMTNQVLPQNIVKTLNYSTKV
ncbi:hypothetical protein [Salinirubrum litoreum]|uniref:Uncharacterized protein n=1 Tax=Salinirubrum litoreum TaxID=1126234 RepID=A0ABD5RB81_9EURY|nr:hypothetical protein [Salinirubrum litoreum]